MSNMDEPEESADSASDAFSDSGTANAKSEIAASQSEPHKDDSPQSNEFAEQATIAGETVSEESLMDESSDDVHDGEMEDGKYEENLEANGEYEEESEEDDEYEEESEEDDEYEEESGEDGEYEEESEEDGEYEEESEEDDEYEEESGEDGEYEEESEEDGEYEEESDSYSEEDATGEDDAYDDEATDGGAAVQELEEGDSDLTMPASGNAVPNQAAAEVALETDARHSHLDSTRAKADQHGAAGDQLTAQDTGGEGHRVVHSEGSVRHAELQFQPVDLPVMRGEPFGMRREGRNGCELLDAMAGRNSVFGFGCTPIREALTLELSGYLGEGSCFANVRDGGDSALSQTLQRAFEGEACISAESMMLLPSPDLAVEYALQLTRRFRSERAFRTIALTGSDHGRTGMCRTASGQPQLHEGLGPMMAGFSHVPLGDLDALHTAMDDQTAGVLLSPIDLAGGAVACDADYLAGVRAACNERGILLIIDETQLVFGSTGNHFSFSEIADIQADIVVASGGLFAGLPGGLVLASQHASTRVVRDLEQYPLLSAALMATLEEMEAHGLPASMKNSAQELAVSIAEQLSGFEFVRDMRVTGMTIGIECDVSAVDVVAAADAHGLRVEPAGDTGILIQPPLLISEEDRQLLLKRLVETMQAIDRETAELAL